MGRGLGAEPRSDQGPNRHLSLCAGRLTERPAHTQQPPRSENRRRSDLSSIGAALQAGFGEITGLLVQNGYAPSGAPRVIYHDVIDETTPGTIEICIPIETEFEAAGRVTSKLLPGGRAASTIHKGPYDETPPAYHSVSDWMTANDFEPAGPPCEIYLNDPTEVPTSEQLTEVLWGVRTVRP